MNAPTPYRDVNAVLQLLLTGVDSVLTGRLAGVYLHGSLASGGFDPARSDVDFLVVTEGRPPEGVLSSLAAMHRNIAASGLKWASKLEGSYIPRDALRRYDPKNTIHPALRVDGSFGMDGHGSDWIIQRHIIHEKGIVLLGPPARELIDPVSSDQLRGAVRGILREWWSPPFPSPGRFESEEYRAYVVLTMCRALYTLHYGTVSSKPVAARWAQQTIGEPWAGLIECALLWTPCQPLLKDETFSFIQYTLGVADA